jgi:predicted RNA binding protein YcfA (HicA-like mRNA interferase family)
VPVHTGSLKRGLLARILKDAGVSREEFLELL